MGLPPVFDVPIGDPLYAAELPPPISVNNLFMNVKRAPDGAKLPKGRFKSKHYRLWQQEACQMLLAQGPRPSLSGPVALIFTLGEQGAPMIDTDNSAKAYIDILVKMRVLPDDNRRVVRHLSITWVPGKRFRVHIHRWIT